MTPASFLFPIYAIAFWLLPVIAVYASNMYGVFPMLLGAAALLVAFLTKDIRRIFDRSTALWLGGLLLLALCSLLWSSDPAHGAEKIMKAFFMYVFGFGFYLCATLVPDDKKDLLYKGAVIAFAFATLVCAVELFLKYPLYRLIKNTPDDVRLPKSIFNHTTVILSLLIWGLAPWLWQKGLRYGFAAAWAFLLWLVVFHGESQSSSAALVMGGAVFCVARLMPKVCFYLMVVLIPAGILLAPWLAQGLFSAFESLSPGKEWIVYGKRLEIWDAVAGHVLQSPLFGHGIEAARHIQDFSFSGHYYERQEILHPHNNILQFWLEFGIIGAGFLIAFLVFVLRRIRCLHGIPHAAVMGGFAAGLTVAAVGYGFWQTWWAGLLFTTAALIRLALRDLDAPRT